MKVVINACHGGFSLSKAAFQDLDLPWNGHGFLPGFNDPSFRVNPALVAAVEKLGSAASGGYAKLKIVEVPDDVKWHIAEYDGYEHIAEDHRTWGD